MLPQLLRHAQPKGVLERRPPGLRERTQRVEARTGGIQIHRKLRLDRLLTVLLPFADDVLLSEPLWTDIRDRIGEPIAHRNQRLPIETIVQQAVRGLDGVPLSGRRVIQVGQIRPGAGLFEDGSQLEARIRRVGHPNEFVGMGFPALDQLVREGGHGHAPHHAVLHLEAGVLEMGPQSPDQSVDHGRIRQGGDVLPADGLQLVVDVVAGVPLVMRIGLAVRNEVLDNLVESPVGQALAVGRHIADGSGVGQALPVREEGMVSGAQAAPRVDSPNRQSLRIPDERPGIPPSTITRAGRIGIGQKRLFDHAVEEGLEVPGRWVAIERTRLHRNHEGIAGLPDVESVPDGAFGIDPPRITGALALCVEGIEVGLIPAGHGAQQFLQRLTDRVETGLHLFADAGPVKVNVGAVVGGCIGLHSLDELIRPRIH